MGREPIPNDLFRAARERLPSPSGAPRPMSRQELADAVNAYLYREHKVKDKLNQDHIGKIERGQTRWPGEWRRLGFRAVLGAKSDTELGFYFHRTTPDLNGMLPDHVHGLPALTQAQLPRRMSVAPGDTQTGNALHVEALPPLPALTSSFLEASPIGQVGAPHGTFMRRPHGHLTASSPAHLDEIVVHLREQWHALVRTDNLLGPRFAIAGVLNQIAVIEELCSGLRGEQRREVVRLGAQYAESAAWLYEDAGNIAQARYWTSQAMELAHEGDDVRMLAWTIFRRSQQASTALDVARAIGFAQAARRNEEQLATPTRAAIRVQEAYCQALDGNELAANTLLDEAHAWAASDIAGDAHEGHGSYCTPGYIEIQRANCWLTTGKPKRAVALYEEALAALPVVYQRSRAAALSRLAVAYVSVGEIEQAAGAAHAALPVARSGGSMRIVDEVNAIGRQLGPHRRLQTVAALLDDLGSDGER